MRTRSGSKGLEPILAFGGGIFQGKPWYLFSVMSRSSSSCVVDFFPTSSIEDDDDHDDDHDDEDDWKTTLNRYKPWAMLFWPLRATDWKRPNSRLFGPYDRFLHSSISREYSGMSYSAFITDFLCKVQLPRLSTREPLPNKQLIQQAAAAKEHEISRANGPQATCARSLLLLAAGDLDQAHRMVQELSTPDASYIHGVIHRIDDDFNNARYWFRGARMHPAGAEMYRRAAAAGLTIGRHSIWDPVLVTDMVEISRTAGVTEELRAILTIEFEELLRSLWNTPLTPHP